MPNTDNITKQEVWPPGSADTACPHPPLMTQVHHFAYRIKKRQRWDVQTMWVYDLDLWPWESEYEVQILVILWLLIFNMTNWPTRLRLITWPCDPDLWRHGACGWCGSSSSICIPSLKFVGLAIRKIWHTMCVSINGPGDPDFWPYDLETGMRVASKVGNLPSKFGHTREIFNDMKHLQQLSLLPHSSYCVCSPVFVTLFVCL